jgi:hypothetical protein
MKKFSFQWWLCALGCVSLLLGVLFRLWQITAPQFLFYDEGMYLGYNRQILNLISANPPKDLPEFFVILGVLVKIALGTAKALWFFLLNLRVFFLGPEAWYFARVISALAGIATIGLTYLFAYRYFQSRRIAIISAVFLSLLPSHVFYSRLGMQESFSTLLFLGALYIYTFYHSKKWSAFVTAGLLCCVFLTNYRMIVAPVFIVAIEIFEALKERRAINWIRLLACLITFGILVYVVGSLFDGINRYVTFGWMSQQAMETKEEQSAFSLLNMFSYPYYVFALEGLCFAMLFWGNLYLVIKKHWAELLPFVLVLIQMAGFTLAAEKGARYLCVVLPFMAIAAAVIVEYLLRHSKKEMYVWALAGITCLTMAIESVQIVMARNDYQLAVQAVVKNAPESGILSTQAVLEQLYVSQESKIKECPKNLGDFIDLYKQGYHFLILDPQAYISWTKGHYRFRPPLIDFLQSIYDQVPPIMTLDHLNPLMLKRFVLDHNKNLGQSLKFLSQSQEQGYGKIRIYPIAPALMVLQERALKAAQK